nr:lycopene cyclase domain-containing protein [Mucilaginibacter straminoryzae]
MINFLTIFFPIVLSFDKRVQFYKTWRFIWPGMLITGLVFLFWDVLFTLKEIWYFNDNYITGIKLLQLPLEEILFFLTVPFACIFIYACLNYYVKWQLPKTISTAISTMQITLSLVLLFFYHDRWYTLITFSLLAVILIWLEFVKKAPWLPRFYLTYLVSLIPFYVVNGLLTSIPIVLYNNYQNIGIRVGTIPFEDHFYSMALLVMNVGFYEYFKKRRSVANG